MVRQMTSTCDVAESADVLAELPVLMQALQDNVIKRSLDSVGCRLVQRALALADDAGRLKIVQ